MRVASSMAVYWKRLIVAPVLALKERNLTSSWIWWPGTFFSYRVVCHRSAANLARKSAYAMALEDAINPCVRNLDVMITGEVPDDPHRAQMIGPPQVRHLVDNGRRRFVGVTLALSSSGSVQGRRAFDIPGASDRSYTAQPQSNGMFLLRFRSFLRDRGSACEAAAPLLRRSIVTPLGLLLWK